MSNQSQEVFRRCIEISTELEGQHRDEDSVAVLRALHAYLDVLPVPEGAMNKSCRAVVEGHLAKTYGRVREKEMKARR
jgi:hypothetical protein